MILVEQAGTRDERLTCEGCGATLVDSRRDPARRSEWIFRHVAHEKKESES